MRQSESVTRHQTVGVGNEASDSRPPPHAARYHTCSHHHLPPSHIWQRHIEHTPCFTARGSGTLTPSLMRWERTALCAPMRSGWSDSTPLCTCACVLSLGCARVGCAHVASFSVAYLHLLALPIPRLSRLTSLAVLSFRLAHTVPTTHTHLSLPLGCCGR